MQKKLFILLLVLNSSTFLSFIMDYSHLKCGEKEIFLLGDFHVKSAIDTKERNIMLRYLSAAKDYDKPVIFVLEENEQNLCNFCISHSKQDAIDICKNIVMIASIGAFYQLFPTKFNHQNLKVIQADCRPISVNDLIMPVLRRMDSLILEKDGYEERRKSIMDGSTASFSKEYQYKDYYKEMQVIQKNLQRYVDENNEKSLETLQEIDNCIARVFSKNQDPCFCYETVMTITDINFYINVVQSLHNADKVVFYAGALHTNYVQERLLRIGFEEVDHQAYLVGEVYKHLKKDRVSGNYFIPMHDTTFNSSLLTMSRLENIFGCSLKNNKYANILFDIGLYQRPERGLKQDLVEIGIGLGLFIVSTIYLYKVDCKYKKWLCWA